INSKKLTPSLQLSDSCRKSNEKNAHTPSVIASCITFNSTTKTCPEPIRLAGTCRQYSKDAMPHIARITTPSGDDLYFGSLVPAQRFLHVEPREEREHHRRDRLLHHLQFDHRELPRADAVGRHLQAVFEERDAPARQDHDPQRRRLVLQVAVPREGHEHVGGE